MKLRVDLSSLWTCVSNMGAKQRSFQVDAFWDDTEIIFDTALSQGLEIDISDLENRQGLLSVRGRQVILFIPDHGFKITETLIQPEVGNKFHIVDCSTLDSMKRKKRFQRYKVTNNLNGTFEIFGADQNGRHVEGSAKLNVCKNCLRKLNYKGADTCSTRERNLIVSEFNNEEFFSIYSSVFERLPRQNINNHFKGYTENWENISVSFREKSGYICDSCRINLSKHKRLLHVHHQNGDKSDNSFSNLIALCADCHRKEPYHNHMFVKHEDTKLINRLRREQFGNLGFDWNKVIKLADLALHGVINHCIKAKYEAPEVGYQLKLPNSNFLELELAWPKRRLGVTIDQNITIGEWKILSLETALEFFKTN